MNQALRTRLNRFSSTVAVASALALAPLGCGSDEPSESTLLPACDTSAALQAAVLDRRQTSFRLSWTAPAGVSTYQVRWAKVPITAVNFDDTSVTTSVAYADAPAAAGNADGVTVSNLYPETSYFFAVAAKNAAGAMTWLQTTAAGTVAHFNVTQLAGSGATNEQFGFQMSGSGDVNGDGHYDLVVGSAAGGKAYLFLGSPGGPAPTTTTTTFSTTVSPTSFARGVSIIGDVDRDGLDDVAISDRLAPAHVYIWKGRTTWPATLSTAQADYVITPDASYNNNALFGSSIARLGDFNGDGADDFVITAQLYGMAQQGRVVIVLGKVGFGSVTLPDTTNTIMIDADPALPTPQFGYRVVGLGHFYSATSGTTVVVAAPGTTTGGVGSEGRLYSFHGQSGTSGVIPIASADHVVVGNALKTRLGNVLVNLGPMFGPLPSVGSGNPVDRSVASGSAWAFSGDASSGPFASHVVVVQSNATNGGVGVVGGGISGVDRSFSLIGADTNPDLVVLPGSSVLNTIYIINGKTMKGPPVPTSPADAASIGVVPVALPTAWVSSAENGATLLPDYNGDGYPDFAITNATGAVPGKVAVYW